MIRVVNSGRPANPFEAEIAGGAAALVWLHGFLGSAADTPVWALRLGPSAPNIFTVELPGHGAASGDPILPYLEFCRLLAENVAAVKRDFQKVFLGGYSLGGRMALGAVFEAGAAASIDGLILVSAGLGLSEPSERAARRTSDEAWAAKIRACAESKDPAGAWRRFVGEWYGQPVFSGSVAFDAVAPAAYRTELPNNLEGLAAALLAYSVSDMPEFGANIRRLTRPLLLVAGRRDVKFADAYRAVHSGLSAATLEIVAESGHAVPLEAPQRFADLLGDWLAAR